MMGGEHNYMFTLAYFKQALERAVRSFAGAYTAAGVTITNDIFSLDSLKVAVGAALFSFLLAYAVKGVGKDKGSASVF